MKFLDSDLAEGKQAQRSSDESSREERESGKASGGAQSGIAGSGSLEKGRDGVGAVRTGAESGRSGNEVGRVGAESSKIGAAKTSRGDMEEAVRRRAYQIYEERGGRGGSETEDWLQAEAELRENDVQTDWPEGRSGRKVA